MEVYSLPDVTQISGDITILCVWLTEETARDMMGQRYGIVKSEGITTLKGVALQIRRL